MFRKIATALLLLATATSPVAAQSTSGNNGGGGGATGSVTAPGTPGTAAQAVQGVQPGVPFATSIDGLPSSKFAVFQVSLPGQVATTLLAAETTKVRQTVVIRCDGTAPIFIDYTGLNTSPTATTASVAFNTSFQPLLIVPQPVSNGQITAFSTASGGSTAQTCTITVSYR